MLPKVCGNYIRKIYFAIRLSLFEENKKQVTFLKLFTIIRYGVAGVKLMCKYDYGQFREFFLEALKHFVEAYYVKGNFIKSASNNAQYTAVVEGFF